MVSIESIEYRNLKLRLMEKGVVLPPCEDCSRLYTEAKNDIMPGFEILIKDFAITVEDEVGKAFFYILHYCDIRSFNTRTF